MPQSHYNSIVVSRRAALFDHTCKAFMFTGVLIYVLAFIHPNRLLGTSLFAGATAYIAMLLFVRRQAHNLRLTLAVNVLSAFSTLLLTMIMLLVSRTGLTLWFYVFTFSIAIFHIHNRHILYLFIFTSLNAVFIWSQVPMNDPMQMPSFFVLLTMTATLSYFSARVTTQNIEDILHTNETLHHTNAELARAQQQAEAANQAKSLFLATMSHELRTPLNAVIGYAEMMRETIEDEAQLEPEQALHDLAQIEHSGKHLLNLVSGVLDLTRIESEHMHLDLQDFSLGALLDSALSMIKPGAQAKSLTLTLNAQIPAHLDTLHQDRTRLEQILLNLLTNAVKFTQAGEVSLRVSAHEEDDIVVEVRDTGVGIAREEHDRIFELFTQVDNSYTREADGAGIGLFLCRKIARRLGGDLTMSSTRGEGSSFVLRVPRKVMS